MERARQSTAQPAQSNDPERLHPSLRDSYVSLPGGDSMLTPEQLDVVFGGDRRALRDIAKLLFQTLETEQNTDE